jgi:hypothetical protein
MKRFLIFIGLFPGIAVGVLIACVAVGARSFPDSRMALELAGWGYVVGAIPALLCAVVDLLLRKTRIPAVIGTALVGYGLATLVASTIFYSSDIGMALAFGLMPLFAALAPAVLGIAGLSLGFGLVGGIPAAVCSWLSGKVEQAGPGWMMRPESGEAR